VRQLALYHHDPLRDDDALDALVARARERAVVAGSEMLVFAATEGNVVDLRSPARSLPKPPTALVPAGGRAPEALADHSVLLAASDPATMVELAAALGEDGLQVQQAASVEQALEMARSAPPSLVIAERDLHGGGAISLCSELHRTDAALGEGPVFAVLAPEGDPAGREAGEKAGVDHWLAAPFTLQLARTKARAWVLRMACRWEKAPLGEDEEQRLRALRALRLLDTEREERFDRYTRIAASLFDVPISLVSLVDRDRQWFKSRHGLEAAETPRDMAFCSHAILRDDVLLVPDALHDPRFADNPLTTGAPHVRFYAGVPLRPGGGQAVGTLCLIDHRPRQLDAIQRRMLCDLGRLVERELEDLPSVPAEAAEGI
jgi:DNA-binding response OmpR family regulator